MPQPVTFYVLFSYSAFMMLAGTLMNSANFLMVVSHKPVGFLPVSKYRHIARMSSYSGLGMGSSPKTVE